jgi:hypothetical protein
MREKEGCRNLHTRETTETRQIAAVPLSEHSLLHPLCSDKKKVLLVLNGFIGIHSGILVSVQATFRKENL